jgi:stearoyl-CoA desaturase (delta-9 desaturase)
LTILTATPLLAIIGLFTIPIQQKTFWFAVFYYYVTGLGAPLPLL